jgi:hypothetical protein
MKYILLIVFPDGERFWSHWNDMHLAEESLETARKQYDCVGTIISTTDFPEDSIFF